MDVWLCAHEVILSSQETRKLFYLKGVDENIYKEHKTLSLIQKYECSSKNNWIPKEEKYVMLLFCKESMNCSSS